MNDLEKYIIKQKEIDPKFAKNFEEGYQKFKRKTIKCECGGKFVEQSREIEGITSPIMVCDQCDDMMFSLEQSKLYHKLRNIQEFLKNEERKISKIGNSMGITLPVKLKELGFNVGKHFNLQIVDENKIIIELQP